MIFASSSKDIQLNMDLFELFFFLDILHAVSRKKFPLHCKVWGKLQINYGSSGIIKTL